jgi:hypothetical protein
MSNVLIQYAGPLNSTAFQARALEGAKEAGEDDRPLNGMIIVNGRGKMFLYGTKTEVNAFIDGFPDVQSKWKAASSNATVLDGADMKEAILQNTIGVSETFRVALPHLFSEE